MFVECKKIKSTINTYSLVSMNAGVLPNKVSWRLGATVQKRLDSSARSLSIHLESEADSAVGVWLDGIARHDSNRTLRSAQHLS
uniref:Uncharacterized protein n=1 Tax=Rhipicephalus zambeziensis TaxID=60191 RepID=A0A224YL70_9ACAR